MQNENRFREFSDSIKRNNICITGVPEKGEEREKGLGNLFVEIIAENFPNLGKETYMQIYKAQRTPKKSIKEDPTKLL